MDDENEKQPLIFFFGAGASVDADIPSTYRFVDDFLSYLSEVTQREEWDDLIVRLIETLQKLEKFNEKIFGAEKKRVDVEQLLDVLNRLVNRDKDVLLYFYDQNAFCDVGEDEKKLLQRLKEELEDFIREKVMVKDERKLEYLKELLNFTFPLEIYSVNYDTCIEQLSHMRRLRYTDGFDTYWDKKNFDGNFDIKHYKMHGSVIWYENERTKEYVKIPIRFAYGKPTNVRLIYGESVKPLLIYPAQKMEYVEPLTELQLMFKERLVNSMSAVLVVVGYSFRDDYIIHMLWDAGRKNEGLYIVVVDPDAQNIFREKLQFINKDERSKSSICDRIVCLPYPFSSVIYRLKNHYLDKLKQFSDEEKRAIQSEKRGITVEWERLLRFCIDCEFSTKIESILSEKIGKPWIEIPFDQPQTRALYAVKAMLHSVIVKNGFENEWLDRVNECMNFLGTENLLVSKADQRGFQLMFKMSSDVTPSFKTVFHDWIEPILNERYDKLRLLTVSYESKLRILGESFESMESFRDYLAEFLGGIDWEEYFRLRNKYEELNRIKELLRDESSLDRFEKIERQVLGIEKRELEKILKGTTFRFQFNN